MPPARIVFVPRAGRPDRPSLHVQESLIQGILATVSNAVYACADVRETLVTATPRPGGRVVMQRTANPCTSVRFRPGPPRVFQKCPNHVPPRPLDREMKRVSAHSRPPSRGPWLRQGREMSKWIMPPHARNRLVGANSSRFPYDRCALAFRRIDVRDWAEYNLLLGIRLAVMSAIRTATGPAIGIGGK